MSKLTDQDSEQNEQFKPKIYQGKRRGQMGNFYDKHNYEQRNYQNRYRTDSRDRRVSLSGGIQCGRDYIDRPRYEQNYRHNFRRGNFRGNMRSNQMYRGQNYRGGYRREYRNENYGRCRSSQEKDKTKMVIEEMIEVAVVDLGQVQEQVPIEIESDAVNVQSVIILQKTV